MVDSMTKKHPVKLIAVSNDPNVTAEELKKEEEMYSMDSRIYSFYRITGKDVQEIIKPHAYIRLNPRSKEHRQVLIAADNF